MATGDGWQRYLWVKGPGTNPTDPRGELVSFDELNTATMEVVG